MDIILTLKETIIQAFATFQVKLTLDDVVIEQSKDSRHGDYATNVCLKYAKSLHQSPKVLADTLMPLLKHPIIDHVELAGPGFINVFIAKQSLQDVLIKIHQLQQDYGRNSIGNQQRINIEFVSANPTGPMHLAHARAAALGDAIANLLTWSGYRVTREFYVNDAGGQILNLARSIYVRYMQHFGLEATIPEDGYHGQDIRSIAEAIVTTHGKKFVDQYDATFFRQFGIEFQLRRIKEDLLLLGVSFDVFRSEVDVRHEGTIEKTLSRLAAYLYVQEGATYLKTTAFGDDKDRVVIKSDGQYTYFLPDIAYHLDKLSRHHDQLIDILGPDHHGYISRMKAALRMLGFKQESLEILVMQLVTLVRGGVEVKMSKRTGVGVTLRELVEDVGKDATRYFILARSYKQPIEFDLDLAQTKSNLNPLYYAQYAFARLSSLLKAGEDLGFDWQGQGLNSEEETDVLKHLIAFPDTIIDAMTNREPSHLTNYLQKLASYTHSFYTNRRVIDREQVNISRARLALVKASTIVFKNVFTILGITPQESM
jgi:arginyl-tRNA synthetase